MDDATKEKLIDWMSNGETGLSSITMARALVGQEQTGPFRSSYPYDGADFRRCALLLKAIGDPGPMGWHKIAAICGVWCKLVAAWPQMMALLNEELPNWEEPHAQGRAPKLYEFIQRIVRP